MKSRLLLICLVLVMALAGFSAASAQENSNCLNLSESDCALVEAGLANFAALESFSQSYSFSLSLSGMAAMDPTAPASISVTSTGSGQRDLHRQRPGLHGRRQPVAGAGYGRQHH